MSIVTSAAAKPTTSDTRAPYIISVSMSTPASSRPIGWLADGGANGSPTFSLGPYGAMYGARIAIRIIATSTTRPKTAPGFPNGWSTRRHPGEIGRPRDLGPDRSAIGSCASVTSSILGIELQVEEVGDQVRQDDGHVRIRKRLAAPGSRGRTPRRRSTRPMPGYENTASTRMAPPTRKPNDSAISVTIGSIEFRRACLRTMRPVRQPLRPRGHDVVLAERLEHRPTGRSARTPRRARDRA